MLFRQLFDTQSSTYTYLLASNKGNAIIVDPVLEKTLVYKTLLEQLDLRLKYSIETHIHADHISGSGQLRELLNCETVSGRSGPKCSSYKIQDEEILAMDEIRLKAIATPGHTDDSYSYLLESTEPYLLFTGDTLLIRGTGRTDFQNGDPGTLYDSITSKLFTLPETTKIFPGHDYNGFTESTIKEEITFNLRLNNNKEDFINIMNSLNLPSPAMMDLVIPLNKNCGLEK
jgi:sulfur dioxygenase